MSSSIVETTTEAASISTAVVTAVAERNGVEPTELEHPLYDVVDPEALDSLFARGGTATGSTRYVVFSYEGCEVRVTGEGDVHVSDADER